MTDGLPFVFAECHALALEAYEPGNRETFCTSHDSGFVVYEPDRIIVAIAGTNDFNDWMLSGDGNLNARPVVFCPGLDIHAGFLESAKEIARELHEDVFGHLKNHPDCVITFTGHSRGGAIAQLLPLVMYFSEYQFQVVTFASPRVFAGSVAERMRQDAYHFQNWSDLVPWLPLSGVTHRYRFCGRVIRRSVFGGQQATLARTPGRLQILLQLAVFSVVVWIAVRARCGGRFAETAKAAMKYLEAGHSLADGYSIRKWWVENAV